MFAQGAAPAGPPIAITGASVINVEDGSVIQNAVVLIEGDRIKAIGPAGSVQLPADARKIALDGKWLAPGLLQHARAFRSEVAGCGGGSAGR